MQHTYSFSLSHLLCLCVCECVFFLPSSKRPSSSSILSSMEKIQYWLANAHNNNNNDNNNNQNLISISPSFSSFSAATSTSTNQETHSAHTLCADSSFNSLKSSAASIPKPSLSYFCIASIRPTTTQISCLAVVQNNDNLLYAASLKEINVFDLTTYDLIDTFGSGSGLVKSISFSGEKIFTAHQDCRIRVWKRVEDEHNHQLISTLPTLKDRFLKSLLAKNYVQIRRHEKKLWIEHADSVSGLAANDDVGLMYSVSWDKSLKIWKTSSDQMHCVGSVGAHNDAVNAVAVDPSDGTVYTGSADGEIRAWRASSRKPTLLTTLKKHESSVNALVLAADGSVLCSGGGDGVIHVWEKVINNDEHNMFVTCSLRGHKGAVLCLVYVNGVIISGSSDRTVRLWKPGKESFSCVGILEGHCKPVKSLDAIPGPGNLGYGNDDDDSLTVFSGSLDGEIRAWKVVINSDEYLYRD